MVYFAPGAHDEHGKPGNPFYPNTHRPGFL